MRHIDESLTRKVVELVSELAGSECISAVPGNAMRKFTINIVNCALAYRETYPQIHFDPGAVTTTKSQKDS